MYYIKINKVLKNNMARKLHGHSYGYGKNPETLLMHELGKKDGMWPSDKMTGVLDYDHLGQGEFLDGITLNGSKIDISDPEIDELTDSQVDAEFADITSDPEMAVLDRNIDAAYNLGSFAVGNESGKANWRLRPRSHLSQRNHGRKSKINR